MCFFHMLSLDVRNNISIRHKGQRSGSGGRQKIKERIVIEPGLDFILRKLTRVVLRTEQVVIQLRVRYARF